jgi:signal transduction histidine kinase
MTRIAARLSGFDENYDWQRLSAEKLLLAVALAFVAAAFLTSEFLHYFLVPDLGRHGERMVAEGLSALVIGCMAAALFRTSIKQREVMVARWQVISEMNHHIRNALAAISFSAAVIPNQQSVRVIQESVDRIEWTLREILPRERPISAQQRDGLRYVSWKKRTNAQR